MRIRNRPVLSVAVLLAAAAVLAAPPLLRPAEAAGRPVVTAAMEGRESGTGRALVTLVGRKLTKVTAVTVLDGDEMTVGAAEILLKTATEAVLRLPDALPAGEYTLAVTAGGGEPIAVAIRAAGAALLTDGSNAMTGQLRSTSNDGFVFGGTFAQGADPPLGPGVRMFWYPKKYAFRAGEAAGDEWDPANIGEGSIATGYNSLATGYGSVSMGANTSSNDAGGVAIGAEASSSGSGSVAIGISCHASSGIAMGAFTQSTGIGSVALGNGTSATGNYSVCLGRQTVAQSWGSLVVGSGNVIEGTTASSVATDPVFVCGNGTSAARSNALTLLRNGNLTISGTLTQNSDARLKTDVTALSGVAEKLAKIRGVSYAFADTSKHPEGRHIGLVAQEVREAFPELVTEGPDGTLSVAYGNFAAVLVEAMKEQAARHEALARAHSVLLAERETEIARLRREHEELAARFARLEAALAR